MVSYFSPRPNKAGIADAVSAFRSRLCIQLPQGGPGGQRDAADELHCGGPRNMEGRQRAHACGALLVGPPAHRRPVLVRTPCPENAACALARAIAAWQCLLTWRLGVPPGGSSTQDRSSRCCCDDGQTRMFCMWLCISFCVHPAEETKSSAGATLIMGFFMASAAASTSRWRCWTGWRRRGRARSTF